MHITLLPLLLCVHTENVVVGEIFIGISIVDFVKTPMNVCVRVFSVVSLLLYIILSTKVLLESGCET